MGGGGVGAQEEEQRMGDELAALDARAQAALVRDGEATTSELVEAAISRIEALDGQLGSVICERFDAARSEAAGELADGPFRGVPILVKDLGAGHVEGMPYHLGNRALRDAGYRSSGDSWLVERLREAGFVILGKTNVPELGFSCTTEPDAYPPSRNPWDTSRSPAGSSGGSAAAVAAGLVPVATASDGGGSIRMPAAVCGLVGLKPSRGRVSTGPQFGEGGAARSVAHVVARTVGDSAALLDVLAGERPGDPVVAPPPRRPFSEEVGQDPGPLRVGVCTSGLIPDGEPDAWVAAAAIGAAETLEDLGHHVEIALPDALTSGDERALSIITVHAASVAAEVDAVARWIGRDVGPDDVESRTWQHAELGRTFSGPAYASAVADAIGWSRAVHQWWADGFDLLLTPTVATPAAPLGELTWSDDPDAEAGIVRFTQYTPAFNWTGQPAISLPLGESEEGLPIGVQLVAAYGREDLLLQVAGQLEEACPWANRRPAVHA